MDMDVRSARWLPQLLLCFLCGCVTLDQVPCFHCGPRSGEVAQVLPLWAGGVVTQPDPMQGGIPVPGMAGRVYLFGPDLKTTVRAEGTLIVHLYDDAPTTGEQRVPREVWTVDPANLTRVLKEDGLGWGYNLWLPWRTYQPSVRNVQLVVCYRREGHPDIWGSATAVHVSSQGQGPSAAPQLQVRAEKTGTMPREKATASATVQPTPMVQPAASAATASLPAGSGPDTHPAPVGP